MSWLDKITYSSAVTIGSSIIGLLVGPYYFLHKFVPGFSSSSDLWEKLILSAAISAPFYVVSYFDISSFFRTANAKEELDKVALWSISLAGIINIFLFYLPIAIHLFFPITKFAAIITMISFEVAFIAAWYVARFISRKDKKSQ